MFGYFIYFSIILVLVGIGYLIKIGINRYFDYQIKKVSNPYQPLMFASSILLVAFITLIAFNPLEFFAQIFGFKITSTLNIFSLTAFIVFVVGIVLLFSKSYKHFQQEVEKREKEQENSLEINFPKEPKEESPHFYERVKELFLLKFEKTNLTLQYDEFEKILYGEYKQGFHKYFLLIYCDEGKFSKSISIEEQKEVFNKLNEIKNRIFEIKENDIVDIFYLLESGEFQVNKTNLITKTEDEFLNELINFEPYLEELVNSYKTDKLFSALAKDEDKLTLAQTFISPYFNESDIKLDSYIDSWLEESNLKHLAILGDYGMGKSSFMKYYSFKLASEILQSSKIKRFPVFISLTNISPMHGGLKDRIGSFVSNKLGVSYRVFEKLINRGKIVFILDGFDEMGFIGTHKQRFKQFNAIWQLATKNNKILISGRPSYFPTEFELNATLNVANKNEEFTKVKPYYELLKLNRFNEPQIKESILKYYSKNETKEYFEFISKNETLLDLCKRPSMMHIVREMLPKLIKDFNSEDLSAGELMKQYINYWIDRQEDKGIVSVFKDNIEAKREFLIEFFRDLAVDLYLSDKLKLPSKEIFSKLKEKLKSLKITNPSEKEGIESEILTGYFIEIDSRDDEEGFKFVHKSFFEYFIALKIVKLIKTKDLKNRFKHKLMKKDWSFEIIDFMYDSIDKKCKGLNIPSLLCIANGKFWGKIKFFTYKNYLKFDKIIEEWYLLWVIISLILYKTSLDFRQILFLIFIFIFLSPSYLIFFFRFAYFFKKSIFIALKNNEFIGNSEEYIKPKTITKYYFLYFISIDNMKNVICKKCDLSFYHFINSSFKMVDFNNSFLRNTQFTNPIFKKVNFENINLKKVSIFSLKILFLLNNKNNTFILFENIPPQNIDIYTINSLKRLIQKQNLEVGKDIKGDEWLMEELKKPIKEIENKS